MIQWTDELKRQWISQTGSSSLFFDTNLFICKQVIDDVYYAYLNLIIIIVVVIRCTLKKQIVGIWIYYVKNGNFVVTKSE